MIWKARNLLVFEAKDSTTEETANKGLMLTREWIQAQNQIKQQPHPLPNGGNRRLPTSTIAG